MTNSSEPNPERTDLSTQELPTIPTVQEIKTWDTENVLRWIQQRNRNILKGDNLEKFNKAYIIGSAFLDADVNFYHETYDLPAGVSLALKKLADEVKRAGKSIPRCQRRAIEPDSRQKEEG
jgi:hypothetical protein